MKHSVWITAHSGAENTADNSLEFVRMALRTGVDALELDVRRGPNGGLYLGHDAVDGNVPGLRQAFGLIAAHPLMQVNCDLKEPGLERDVAALAADCGLSDRLVLSGTVDAAAAAEPALHGAAVFLNIEEYVPAVYRRCREEPEADAHIAAEMAGVCRRYGVSVANVCERLVTRRFLTVLAEAGVGVSVWTVNEPDELAWFLAQGVRNITTRCPLAALALRRK